MHIESNSLKNFLKNFWQPWNAPKGKRVAPVIGFIAATVLSLGAFLPMVGIVALTKWAIKHIKDSPSHVQESAAKVGDVADAVQPKTQELPKNESKPDTSPPVKEKKQAPESKEDVKVQLKWTSKVKERDQELENLRTRYFALNDVNGSIFSSIETPLKKSCELLDQLEKLESKSPMSEKDILAAAECDKEISNNLRRIHMQLKTLEDGRKEKQ